MEAYKHVKDSGIPWTGKIPIEWETRKIKYLQNPKVENSFIDGDWIESPYISDEGIRYLTTGNIGDGVYKEQGNGYITLEVFNKLNCKYAYSGDLVFSRLNAPYGRSCILPDTFDKYVLAVDNVILRTEENIGYICYVTQCEGYQHSIEDLARGTTMKRISRTNLGNIKIPLPPRHIQNAIVSYLDSTCSDIDTAIAEAKASIEDYKLLKQAIITKAVTKGLNPNTPMKDSGIEWIGEIPEYWSTSKLNHISKSIQNGYVGPTRDLFVDEGIKYIQSLHIKEGAIDFNKQEYYVREEWANEHPKIHKDQLLIVQTGDIGQVGLVDSDYDNCNCHALIIVSLNKQIVLPKFVTYYFMGHPGKELLLRTKTGALLPHLNSTRIGSTPICYPSYKEQEQIADFLDTKCSEINSLICEKEAMIADLESYKKSLIFEVVTGKKKVC